MERTETTPSQTEQELRDALVQDSLKYKGLLIRLMEEKIDQFPHVGVRVGNGVTTYIKAVSLGFGTDEASIEEVFLTTEGMFRTHYEDGIGSTRFDRVGLLMPAWHKKQEVEPIEYLEYAGAALNRITEAANREKV